GQGMDAEKQREPENKDGKSHGDCSRMAGAVEAIGPIGARQGVISGARGLTIIEPERQHAGKQGLIMHRASLGLTIGAAITAIAFAAPASADPADADANYLRAWRLFHFGQWPAATSPGKQANYRHAVEAYLAHARSFDPPMETVRIPFEGGSIVGYLRLPKAAGRPV